MGLGGCVWKSAFGAADGTQKVPLTSSGELTTPPKARRRQRGGGRQVPSASDGTPTLGLQVSTLLRPSNSNQTHSTGLPGCPARRWQIWECLMVTGANSCNKPPQVCVYTLKVLFLSRNSDRLLGGQRTHPRRGPGLGPRILAGAVFSPGSPGVGCGGKAGTLRGVGDGFPVGKQNWMSWQKPQARTGRGGSMGFSRPGRGMGTAQRGEDSSEGGGHPAPASPAGHSQHWLLG